MCICHETHNSEKLDSKLMYSSVLIPYKINGSTRYYFAVTSTNKAYTIFHNKYIPLSRLACLKAKTHYTAHYNLLLTIVRTVFIGIVLFVYCYANWCKLYSIFIIYQRSALKQRRTSTFIAYEL